MLQKAAEITEHLGCFSTGPVISWDKRLLFYIMGAGVLSMILTSPGSNVSPLFFAAFPFNISVEKMVTFSIISAWWLQPI